jgi:Pyruvate/2-oxoglutarate dehydrogenase complex, dihydrolipoamide acyltransferase (E2) component, and related enzymes
MSEKILVPELGESITEATLSKWLKNKGDTINADEPVVELETEKVNLEVPSPITGVVSEVNFKNGDTVEVGAILGTISESKNKKIEKIKNVEKIKSSNFQNVIKLKENKEDEIKIFQENKKENNNLKKENKDLEEPLILTEEISKKPKKEEKPLSPAVRKIVAEKKIKIEEIKGTGKDGRILKGDLINLMGVKPQPSQRKIEFGEEERIKMSRLRLTIAKRLKEAQENAAMLTTFNEVDMSNIMSMRKENQEDFQNRYGVKLRVYVFCSSTYPPP